MSDADELAALGEENRRLRAALEYCRVQLLQFGIAAIGRGLDESFPEVIGILNGLGAKVQAALLAAEPPAPPD